MKHLRKFKTKAERNAYMAATPLPAYPYVHYLEDTQDILYGGPEVDIPFYVECLNGCALKISTSGFQCSSDGVTWGTFPSQYTFKYSGERLYIKASGKTASSSAGIGTFSASAGSFNVGGNIMSLVYGDDYRGQTVISQTDQFYKLFQDCTALRSARKLALPATTLTTYCYNSMFNGCTNLVNAPALPATTLAGYCYSDMFNGCTNLVNAPALPATTLATYCYSNMFKGCTNLVNAPALPATTLATYCYSNMFKGCTKLSYIKAMFTTAPGTNYSSNWVEGVAAEGTFVKNSAATWTTTGLSAVPTGWTVELADA